MCQWSGIAAEATGKTQWSGANGPACLSKAGEAHMATRRSAARLIGSVLGFLLLMVLSTPIASAVPDGSKPEPSGKGTPDCRGGKGKCGSNASQETKPPAPPPATTGPRAVA